MRRTQAQILRVPPTVWALGFVSLFMDVSSEMIHGLLPVFLVGTLGASPTLLGLIEGIAEATAAVGKAVSGGLSDRLGRRKGLIVLGYGLAAATKPVFPLAATPYQVLAARFVDRIGKGFRDAPRDALIADVTPRDLRGASYGLRQSLDTVGAFLGPLAAIVLMAVLHGRMRAVFGVAVAPAAVAVLILLFVVREPATAAATRHAPEPVRWRDAGRLGAPFWIAVAVGALFTLARFSEAFLVLRGADAGLGAALAPVTLIVMNLVYAAAAAPAGSFSDRVGRKGLLALGMTVLVAADLMLAYAASLAGVLGGVALWGLHMALTQGLLAAAVADRAPADLRGTAFGLFNLATGAATLAASVVAGALWQARGPAVTFQAGAGFALLALAGALVLLKDPGAGTSAAADAGG
jgi:MFS family permease